MRRVWEFLQVKRNREILAWLGGGAVVVAGALWTAVTFFSGTVGSRPPAPAPDCTIEANQGIAACRDQLFHGPVTIGGSDPERE